MKIQIEIDCANAAFEVDLEGELNLIFRVCKDKCMQKTALKDSLYDTNGGSKVGFIKITEAVHSTYSSHDQCRMGYTEVDGYVRHAFWDLYRERVVVTDRENPADKVLRITGSASAEPTRIHCESGTVYTPACCVPCDAQGEILWEKEDDDDDDD